MTETFSKNSEADIYRAWPPNLITKTDNPHKNEFRGIARKATTCAGNIRTITVLWSGLSGTAPTNWK